MASLEMDALALFAIRTPNTLRPQPRFKVLPRRVVVRKHLEELDEANRDAITHGGFLSIDDHLLSRGWHSALFFHQRLN